jgi:hypothetical protein
MGSPFWLQSRLYVKATEHHVIEQELDVKQILHELSEFSSRTSSHGLRPGQAFAGLPPFDGLRTRPTTATCLTAGSARARAEGGEEVAVQMPMKMFFFDTPHEQREVDAATRRALSKAEACRSAREVSTSRGHAPTRSLSASDWQ